MKEIAKNNAKHTEWFGARTHIFFSIKKEKLKVQIKEEEKNLMMNVPR